MSQGIESWAATSEPYGKGRKAPLGALTDAALLESLQRYKRQVAKRYRVVEPDGIDRLLPDETLLFSPKLDGELWFLVHRKVGGASDVALVAYNGRVLYGVSCLTGLTERLKNEPPFVVAGELHVVSETKDRSRVHHVATTLGDPKSEDALAFSAFDVLDEDGTDAQGRPYPERFALLQKWLGEGKPALVRLGVVPTESGKPSDVAKRYRSWVLEGGAEGVVVRSDRGLTYKIKPTTTVDVVVLAYGERITGDVHQVRELQVGLLRDDGTYQLVGSVGGGFSEDDRVRWLSRLKGLETKSSFRLANREGTLCRFLRPEVIVEVRVSDFITTDGWDVPLRRMSLGYDPEAGWKAITETRTPVLLHPVLVRERTDKKVDIGSVGFTQITSFLDSEGPEERAVARTALASVIELRRVFTKVTKGETAVRKVVIVRTNKEREGMHPPFVVFTTDFSPNRKTPLDTGLRTAASRPGADAIVEAWLEENVKRGWTEVGGAAPAEAAKPAPKEAEPVKEGPVKEGPVEEGPAKKPRAKKKKSDEA
jgi:hypothetical protein